MVHTTIDDMAKTFRLRPHSRFAHGATGYRQATRKLKAHDAFTVIVEMSPIAALVVLGALVGLSGLL